MRVNDQLQAEACVKVKPSFSSRRLIYTTNVSRVFTTRRGHSLVHRPPHMYCHYNSFPCDHAPLTAIITRFRVTMPTYCHYNSFPCDHAPLTAIITRFRVTMPHLADAKGETPYFNCAVWLNVEWTTQTSLVFKTFQCSKFLMAPWRSLHPPSSLENSKWKLRWFDCTTVPKTSIFHWTVRWKCLCRLLVRPLRPNLRPFFSSLVATLATKLFPATTKYHFCSESFPTRPSRDENQ